MVRASRSGRPDLASGADLGDTGLYLDFFSRTLDFAICPHKNRHPVAATAGIGDKARTWDWLVDPVRANVPDPDWRHQEQVGRHGIIFARLLRKTGGCRLPFSLGPSIATQLFEMWSTVPDRLIS